MTNEEFADKVMSCVPADFTFKPTAHYDPDGDCIEFFASDENFYAERVDSLVTVYYGMETSEIVGSQIKGVSKFLRNVLQQSPGFRIEIHDGRIKLVHLFTAKLWSEEIDAKTLPGVTYQKLRQVAEQTGTEVEVGDLA